MDAHHIIAGFSDIKVQFLEKTETTTSLEELQLWYIFEDNILFARDSLKPEADLMLAVYNEPQKSWTTYLRENSYGGKLVEYLIGSTPLEKLQDEFNHQNELHCFRPFRRG